MESQTLAFFVRNILPQVKFSPLVFLDADNYPRGLDVLMNRGRDCSEYHAIIFVGSGHNSSSVAKLSTYSWCSVVRAQKPVKDAADHCMSLVAVLANEIVSCDVPFHLMSLDRFIEELVENLAELQPNRKIVHHTPDTFGLLATSTILSMNNSTKEVIWYTPNAGRSINKYAEEGMSPPSMDKTSAIHTMGNPHIHEETFDSRFLLYVNILNLEFVATNQLTPLLSLVGLRITRYGMSKERGGLKPFTAEAIRLGLITKHGTEGGVYIVILPDKIHEYLRLSSTK
jgi:hypothetical protein